MKLIISSCCHVYPAIRRQRFKIPNYNNNSSLHSTLDKFLLDTRKTIFYSCSLLQKDAAIISRNQKMAAGNHGNQVSPALLFNFIVPRDSYDVVLKLKNFIPNEMLYVKCHELGAQRGAVIIPFRLLNILNFSTSRRSLVLVQWSD